MEDRAYIDATGRFPLHDRRKLMRPRDYKYWLSMLKIWTTVRKAPMTEWSVQYDDQPVLAKDPDWRQWIHADARLRRLSAKTAVPWDNAALLFDTQGEALLLVNQVPAYGLNPFHQLYRPGRPRGTVLELTIEQVQTGLMGTDAVEPGIADVYWVALNPVARACYWDLAVLLEWVDRPEVEPNVKAWLEQALDQALTPLYQLAPDEPALRSYLDRPGRHVEEEGLHRALKVGPVVGLRSLDKDMLQEGLSDLKQALEGIYAELGQRVPKSPGELLMLGHAHIDWAWLWPTAETRRKVVRTAASQAALLDQFSGWRFGMSSPQMWTVLEEHPQFFQRWLDHVRAGRVEPLGAFWLESDNQLISGASMLRQLVYGLRYFEKVAGRRPQTAFLPDSFGFSGAMPTLLHAAGVKLFLTTKINWNDTTAFPYKNFRWIGPDGSSVQAMIFGSGSAGYNGNVTIKDLTESWQRFAESGHSDRVLYAFGWGDGGGGPDEEMLERLDRYQRLPLLPKLVSDAPESLIDPEPSGLPRYRGDLYLEYHRGVFTAQTAVKTGMRRAEAQLLAAEAWQALAGGTTPLQDAWRLLLNNQFHDILPGSSIASVYQDFADDMSRIDAVTAEAYAEALPMLIPAGSQPALVVGHAAPLTRPAGPLTVERDQGFALLWDGSWHEAQEIFPGSYAVDLPDLPPWSLATFPLRTASSPVAAQLPTTPKDALHLLGPEIEVTVGPDGIRQIQVQGRSLLAETAGISAFFQHPSRFDAWELVHPDKRGAVAVTHDPLVVEASSDAYTVVRLVHHAASSIVEERLIWDAARGRLSTKVSLTMADRHLAIQYRLPTTLVSDYAHRETLWGVDTVSTLPHSPGDAARFEWAAHRWVDLSEPSVGLSLYNDGRFGHSVDGGTLSITLATAPLFPDPTADQQPTPVTLGLVVHQGPLMAAQQLAEAHAFSAPPVIVQGTLANDQPVVAAPISGLPPNVALVAFKTAEDGSGDWICHFGEMIGDHARIPIMWSRPVQSVMQVDLVSEIGHEAVDHDDAGYWLELGAHQVAVWRVVVGD